MINKVDTPGLDTGSGTVYHSMVNGLGALKSK
jgi:hypothetical protein